MDDLYPLLKKRRVWAVHFVIYTEGGNSWIKPNSISEN